MNKAVTFVYFDLGGVMFNYQAALIELAHQNNLAVTDFNTILDQYDYQVSVGEISLQELWEIYKKKLHLHMPLEMNFFEYWTDRFIPIHPMHHLATQISTTHAVGILSNLYENVLEKSLRNHSVPDLSYASIIESYKVKCAKPDNEIYKIAQQRAKTPAENILFIDDKQENIKTAKNLGWQVIQFHTTNPEKSIHEIKEVLNGN